MERYTWATAGKWTTVHRDGKPTGVLIEFYRVVGGPYGGEITRNLPLARGMASLGGRVEAVGYGASCPVPKHDPHA